MIRHADAPSLGVALERSQARVRELEAEVARLRGLPSANTWNDWSVERYAVDTLEGIIGILEKKRDGKNLRGLSIGEGHSLQFAYRAVEMLRKQDQQKQGA
jgi:hypothetical protein